MSSREFGGLVRGSRERLGLSQTRVGELVGRAPATVRAWERNQSIPNDSAVLSSLAAVLGLDEVELFAMAGVEAPMVIERFPTIEQSLREIAPPSTRAPHQPRLLDVTDEPAPVETNADAEEGSKGEVRPSSSGAERVAPADEAPVSQAASEIVPAPVLPVAIGSVDVESLSGVVEMAAPRRRDIRPSIPPGEPLTHRIASTWRSIDLSWLRRKRAKSNGMFVPSSPSYVEIPEQRRMYRMRALYTAGAMTVVVILFLWSFSAAREAANQVIDLLLQNL